MDIKCEIRDEASKSTLFSLDLLVRILEINPIFVPQFKLTGTRELHIVTHHAEPRVEGVRTVAAAPVADAQKS